uniref:Uncharacterized protein n=1 Tax=Triticum urartu TaxID=4572 RepID=A0A8R7P5X3_TRIUA
QRAVPVVLDGEVRPPGELGGDDGPAVRSNADRSRSVNQRRNATTLSTCRRRDDPVLGRREVAVLQPRTEVVQPP